MSGYVILSKDLVTDIRFRRVVRAYIASRERHASDATALSYETGVTHVLGALAQLWIFADTHIRDDNTIEASVDEIDELVGIAGFCKLLPADWLQVLEPNCIQLTDFLQHNGTVAKKKANHAKRQARYRDRQKTGKDDATPSPRAKPRDAVASPSLPLPTQPNPNEEKRVPSEPVEQKLDGAVERVFEHWRSVYRKPRASLDQKRRKLIRTALREYDEATLCQAISGYQHSPHHMGQNDRQTVYDDIELMLRDAKHVEAGLGFHANGSAPKLSTLTRRNVEATADWIPPEMRSAAS